MPRAGDLTMGAWAGEVVRRRGAVGGREVGSARLAVQGDGRDGDGWLGRQLLLEVLIGCVAGELADPVPEEVDDDLDKIVVVEGAGGAVERRIVEVPAGRELGPDQPGHVAPVGGQPPAAPLGGEVEEEPQPGLEGGPEGVGGGGDVLDEIAPLVDRHQARATLGPQCGGDAGATATP